MLNRRWRLGLGCLLLGLCISCVAESLKQFKELLVAIELNGQDMNQVTLVLTDRYNRFYVHEQDLTYWRVQIPSGLEEDYKGERYYPLSAFKGVLIELEPVSLELRLTFPSRYFSAEDVTVYKPKLKPQRPQSFGAYLNYDISAPSFPDNINIGAVVDGAVFHRYGVVSGQVLGQDLNGASHIIRLNTTYTLDNPEKMTTLRVGDTVNQPGMWGSTIGFAGLQYSTNFATQPDFITYPLPKLSGDAVFPSVVDLYINNALILQRDVAPGPFNIDALPVISGRGQVSLVTRDLLGRERVVTLPYYASSNLLRKGLSDYSYSAGLVRQNFGVKSNDYHEGIAVATHRYGVSDKLTTELRGEFRRRQQALGAGASVQVSDLGIIDTAVAVSNADDGQGALMFVGLDHQSQKFNFATSMRYTTQHFHQLGFNSTSLPPKLEATAFFGIPIRDTNNIGISYVGRVNRETSNTNFVSLSYGFRLLKAWQVSISALKNIGGERAESVFLTLTRSLDANTTFSLNANHQTKTTQGGFQLNRNTTRNHGLAYYLTGNAGEETQLEGGVTWEDRYGVVSAQGTYQNNQGDYRVDAQGGVAYLGGQWFVSRPIQGSFGVIQVPGYPGVGVYHDNQLVAHTNNKGYAFVPDLQAFALNQISVDPKTLPMDAKVSGLSLHAVPYYQSGVLLTFPIEPLQGGIMQVKRLNGKPLPAGTTVKVKHYKAPFWVGLDGELYVSNLLPNQENEFLATWPEGQCRFLYTYKPSHVPMPDLGEVICQ